MKAKKKVLIIAYHFPPMGGSGVQRTVKFVKYLREFGWEPVVLAPKEFIRKKQAYDEGLLGDIPKGVKVIRIYTLDLLVSVFLRLSYFLGFRRLAGDIVESTFIPDHRILWLPLLLPKVRRILKDHKIDVIYTSAPPGSLCLIGMILKKIGRVKWVSDHRDPWTHNALYNPKYHYVGRTNKYLELKSHHNADRVIANTPGNREKIIDDFRVDGKKVVTITNGYDEEDFMGLDPYKEGFGNDKFNIVYTGTFYDGYAPDTFLRALNNLLADSRVSREDTCFHMAGFLDIKDKDRIFGLVNDLQLDGLVNYHGSLAHRESNVLMMKADLLLLILPVGKGSDSWVPGKLYEYLRCGRPILALIPEESDCGDIIKSAHAGFIAPPGDVEKIEAEIVRCYTLWKEKKLAIKPVREKVELYERKRLTQQLAEVLDSVVGTPLR